MEAFLLLECLDIRERSNRDIFGLFQVDSTIIMCTEDYKDAIAEKQFHREFDIFFLPVSLLYIFFSLFRQL